MMMMMHAKSDSDDVTSLAPSSPQRQVYYVQSPSDDGSKSSSMHATPVFNSPFESPSYSSYARHSRESSASRVSGLVKWAAGRRRSYKPHCAVIDEEADYYAAGDQYWQTIRCRILIALFCISLAFGASCLIVWGAAKPFKADITVLSLKMNHFYFGQGSDLTGVPTKLVTLNCSVTMMVHNPATFFGIHVGSMPVNMMYSQIKVATGELEGYYQPRKSYRTISVNLEGSKVPLYGAGASMALATLDRSGRVPMRLMFSLWSRGDVVGKLVKSTHRQEISCSLIINRHDWKPIKLKRGSCTST